MESESTQEFFEYRILGRRYPLPQIEGDSETKELILLNTTLLFARKGFSSVTMRDIADSIGIKPASLYNHFPSKEVLWKEVLKHTERLYTLYFAHLDEQLQKSASFENVLKVIFLEPEKLVNTFTCYAFSLIQAEQFRDEDAGTLFNDLFLKYSIEFIQGWFDKCVAKGQCPPFDTKTVATIIMHSTLVGLEVKVQEYLERPTPYDPATMFRELHNYILTTVRAGK